MAESTTPEDGHSGSGKSRAPRIVVPIDGRSKADPTAETDSGSTGKRWADAKERENLAARATYEISVLIDLLARELDNDESATTEYLMPLFLRRMREINSVAMSVLSHDDGRTTGEMAEVIYAC